MPVATLQLPAGPYALEVVTHIKPQENTSLEGLYKSSGNFCTQAGSHAAVAVVVWLPVTALPPSAAV